MAGVEHSREPCPDRILDDVGSAFALGAFGGGVIQAARGIYNSPAGLMNRSVSAFDALRIHAPRTGGSFAIWTGLFRYGNPCAMALDDLVSSVYCANSRHSPPLMGQCFCVWCMRARERHSSSSYDCALVALRRKEDGWNAIASGFLTGGTLAIRSGPGPALRSAMVGGVLLAMIEGVGIMLMRMVAPPPPAQLEMYNVNTSSTPVPSSLQGPGMGAREKSIYPFPM